MRSLIATTTLTLLLATGCSQAPADAPAGTALPPTPEVDPAGSHAGHDDHSGHEGDEAHNVLATAVLVPTAGNQVQGTLYVSRVGDQLRLGGEISGLGVDTQHGFHIHEKGDCSAADGSSAGGHFNPTASEHGAVEGEVHHGGDMSNLVADANGNARVDAVLSTHVTAGDGSATDIIGRGLIVHADPDDYVSQPTGNAGARLACAVITAAQ